jgi:hypothetical protein
MQSGMMLIIDIGNQPEADYYQDAQHNERERVHDHAVSVVVLLIVAFESSEANMKPGSRWFRSRDETAFLSLALGKLTTR